MTKLYKMYEWATGKWLFNPEGSDDLSRDLMHLAQMTECTGQHHEEATLQRYRLRHGLQQGMCSDKLQRLMLSNLSSYTRSSGWRKKQRTETDCYYAYRGNCIMQ